MSGSPVLAQFYSHHSGLVRDDQILGIYAGRYMTPVERPTGELSPISTFTEDSGLGYAFKPKAILEILNQIDTEYPSGRGLK